MTSTSHLHDPVVERQRFEEVLELIDLGLEGWSLHLGADGSRFFVQVRHEGQRHRGQVPFGGAEPWSGRKWLLSPWMTTTEIVNTCLMAFLAAVRHEALESITYRQVAIYSPHASVDDLAERPPRADVRPNAMQGA